MINFIERVLQYRYAGLFVCSALGKSTVTCLPNTIFKEFIRLQLLLEYYYIMSTIVGMTLTVYKIMPASEM